MGVHSQPLAVPIRGTPGLVNSEWLFPSYTGVGGDRPSGLETIQNSFHFRYELPLCVHCCLCLCFLFFNPTSSFLGGEATKPLANLKLACRMCGRETG